MEGIEQRTRVLIKNQQQHSANKSMYSILKAMSQTDADFALK